ncbi:hypothetical protein [Kutzneria sp. 744]|uniref:hypothetical protein n=1 Tax=Kutzneria sp. (strain 744) TaxID=345341 RepID=UPI0003EEB7EE|nr:hypothetical protein [Kutzneria sp. 744]EWM19723.1 hypothetical protein KUTG_10027 [Kutzneria sp. 744]
MTAPASDDDRVYDPTGMCGPDTIAARRELVGKLIALPQIQTATITCDSAPLQIEGALSDGRRFYFRGRSGKATLSIAESGQSPHDSAAATARTECAPGECTERAAEAVALVRILLAEHDRGEGSPR